MLHRRVSNSIDLQQAIDFPTESRAAIPVRVLRFGNVPSPSLTPPISIDFVPWLKGVGVSNSMK
jgi:hypothetical protein